MKEMLIVLILCLRVKMMSFNLDCINASAEDIKYDDIKSAL